MQGAQALAECRAWLGSSRRARRGLLCLLRGGWWWGFSCGIHSRAPQLAHPGLTLWVPGCPQAVFSCADGLVLWFRVCVLV